MNIILVISLLITFVGMFNDDYKYSSAIGFAALSICTTILLINGIVK